MALIGHGSMVGPVVLSSCVTQKEVLHYAVGENSMNQNRMGGSYINSTSKSP